MIKKSDVFGFILYIEYPQCDEHNRLLRADERASNK